MNQKHLSNEWTYSPPFYKTYAYAQDHKRKGWTNLNKKNNFKRNWGKAIIFFKKCYLVLRDFEEVTVLLTWLLDDVQKQNTVKEEFVLSNLFYDSVAPSSLNEAFLKKLIKQIRFFAETNILNLSIRKFCYKWEIIKK